MNSNGATTSGANGGRGGGDAAAEPRRQSKRPKYSRFTQQELPACKPLLTPGWVISAFMIVGVIFIPIGVISLVASHRVVEVVDRYETECIPEGYRNSRDSRVEYIKSNRSKDCTRTLMSILHEKEKDKDKIFNIGAPVVPKHMKAPVYVYYQLDNFYQNHRRLLPAPSKCGSADSFGVSLIIPALVLLASGNAAIAFFNPMLPKLISTIGVSAIVLGTSVNALVLRVRPAVPGYLRKYPDVPGYCWTYPWRTIPVLHTGYVKSRNDEQLRNSGSANETDSCKPEATTGNNLPIVPCGLIAWSLFNDTYNFSIRGTPLSVNKKHISWKSDREHKFGKNVFPQNFQQGTLKGGGTLNDSKPLNEQEDLIVWMRTAALPTFRKLYGKIEKDLYPNDTITVNVGNYYNTYSFSGKKKLVLSTTSFLGGKNNFLGIAYLTVGGLCFFLAMVFFLVHIIKPRPLGDPAYLSWNRNPPEGRSN
ncbi:hypothetical protein KI387_031962 [Taxus chinensis]|uniref:ALA-interacting subunit n=1 Tax=Taxus chinensis TaxID=29808 RepID=A0AA38F2Q1_TAXCH|nr:hypothetical protein KI387_031962 [Taxus chinensis]